MITGFNTDIQFEGVTYHVQTEDKGIKTPLILSLVYVGGTVIASKRTPYQDLVEQGFDEQSLTERLQRQHKLICAAIRAGRVADLKKMSGDQAARADSAPAGRSETKTAGTPPPAVTSTRAPAGAPPDGLSTSGHGHSRKRTPDAGRASRVEPAPTFAGDAAEKKGGAAAGGAASGDAAASGLYEGEVAVVESLYLSLLEDEGEFRAGQFATIKIHVGRGGFGRNNIAGAAVTIKVLGTTFRPLLLSTQTDGEGVAAVRALLPRFTSGRAAIIIRAAVDGETAELRRIIHHS